MEKKPDEDTSIRCRRLGHDVTLRYCACEQGDTPCPLIINCWWEILAIHRYLAEHFPPDLVARLESAAAEPRPSKVASLVDIIRQTRDRLAAAESKTDPAEDPTNTD